MPPAVGGLDADIAGVVLAIDDEDVEAMIAVADGWNACICN